MAELPDSSTPAQNNLRDRRARLESAFAASAGEVEGLLAEIQALRTIGSRNDADIDDLRWQLLRTEDQSARLHRQCIELSQQLSDSDSRARELEQSTSFRLGYAVVNSLKSPRGAFALFPLLWRLAIHRSKDRPGAPGPLQKPASLPVAPEPSEETESPARRDLRTARRRPSLLRVAPLDLSALRVAAVMDEFTRSCFLPTCEMQTLHAARYEKQLTDLDPHLLLVESAWNGDDGSWRNKVSTRSGELLGLLDLCKRRGIPTVFWNKEDPSHFDNFLETARLFEHVFTTDIDSIRRYRLALGHERIHLMPFACQPRIHNPVVEQERRHAFSFAGSYYHRYPERCEDMDRLVSTLSPFAPVVIYDRNSGRGDPAFVFPHKYAQLLNPALPYSRINEAYKGYRFAINLTTIKQSQSMFARRVYELVACNTVTISNYSRGLRQLFGDVVIASDIPETLERRIQPFLESPALARRIRLKGLRKVMLQHTYEIRMQYLAERVLGKAPSLHEQSVEVLARVCRQQDLDAILAAFASQTYGRRRLFLVVASGFVPAELPTGGSTHVLRDQDAAEIMLAELGRDGWVAALNPADHYGPDYLQDLVLATRYSDDPFIGKGAYHERVDGEVRVLAEERRYRRQTQLLPRACIARMSSINDRTVADWLDEAAHADSARAVRGLSIDEFNYCRNGAGGVCHDVDGTIEGFDSGLDIEELMQIAERLPISSSAPAAGAADFLAMVSRREQLQVAADPSHFAEMHRPGSTDLFIYCAAPTGSFVEIGMQDAMQGTAQELNDLLSTGRYGVVWIRAPDAAACRLLRVHADTCEFRVRLTDADLARAPGNSPWLALLSEAYPRIHALLDNPGSIHLLEVLLGPAKGLRYRLVTES